jgi:hypothetical protein
MGQEMALRITQQDGSGTYDAFQASGPGMYETTGGACDWDYGYTYYHKGSNLLAYTIETCQSFHPNESVLDQVIRENFDAALYACDVADSIRSVLVPYVLPPAVAPLDSASSPDFEINWTEANRRANAEMYELEERMGFTAVVDSAEDGTGLWFMEGFTTSSARVHDGSYSFHSALGGTDADTASAMTTIHPLPVKENDSLTFWYYANIEEFYDYGYAEVSTDGKEWHILEYFTGDKGWDRVAYSLEDYVGQSVFFRFRYAKDDMDPLSFEGLYVDAIGPVATFDSVGVLSSAISDTFWAFTGKDPGEYWYRVKGYNTPKGWGHYGQLVHTEVPTGVAQGRSRRGAPRFEVSQNRPNPFVSNTTVSLMIPTDMVGQDLRIIDQAGRVVRTIELSGGSVDDQFSSVRHEVTWDGRDDAGRRVPSGVYFYKVGETHNRMVRKMVLAR